MLEGKIISVHRHFRVPRHVRVVGEAEFRVQVRFMIAALKTPLSVVPLVLIDVCTLLLSIVFSGLRRKLRAVTLTFLQIRYILLSGTWPRRIQENGYPRPMFLG